MSDHNPSTGINANANAASTSSAPLTPSRRPLTLVSTSTSSSPPRVAVGHDIESVAGYISGEYSCVYSQVNGTLYAGSTALYFLGTFFLFDKKLRLPWEDIRQVQKMEQGIGIQVLTNNDVVYSFTGIHSPDRAWVVLVSLHNDALLDRTPTTPRQPYTPVQKRRNSDPSLSSIVDFDMYLRNDDDDGEENKDGSGSGSGITVTTATATATDISTCMKTPSVSLTPSNVFSSTGGPDLVDIEKLIGKLSLQPIRSSHGGVAGKL
jgi:hypothetical protein